MPNDSNLDLIDWQALPGAPILGVDEVGRGCLAGPVCAGAARLNPEARTSYLTDSKKLSAKKREAYAARIVDEHEVALGWASVEEIDELNILQASFLAMRRAIHKLAGSSGGHVVVDGSMPIAQLEPKFRQSTYIKGDLRLAPISAAAIVAKVERDAFMVAQAKIHPAYGLDKHKGYSTQAHKDAIAQWGPCMWHRKSFKGVREFVGFDPRPTV